MIRIARSRERRGQAAVDFMTSYGIAILIVAIAIYVVVRLGVFGNSLAQPGCVAAPSFSCGTLIFNSNGVVTFVLSQNLGGTINITGVACSQGVNVIGNLPQYGNIWVGNYIKNSQYYPNPNKIGPGVLMYSDSSNTLSVYCYGASGLSSLPLGVVYTGYVWLNYTYAGLPGSYHTIERALQFTAGAS